MTYIFYSSIAPTGVYTDGEGNYVEIKWKAHVATEINNKVGTKMKLPPPPVTGVGERWDRITEALESIAKSLRINCGRW